ncbi:MAG: hypothetical protein Q8L23_12135 [Caulobacter sp.]|nr:hypothetical protein [Caulobacter sp.]
MKSIISAAMAALLLLSASAAGAAEFTPAPNAGYVIDLDTPDNSMSLWQLDEMSGISALRARVTFVRVGKKTAYGPATMLILSNGQSEASLTFLLTPKGSVAMLSAKRGETELGRELFLMPIDPKETFGLEIDWTPEGKVTVRIATKAVKDMGGDGFERHEVTMDGAPTQIKILGGGSETEFKPLTLGAAN